MAVTGGTVYITGDVGGKLMLFAFDLDGKPKWKVEHGAGWRRRPGRARAARPTIDGGKLYLAHGNGMLGCFDAKTGTPACGPSRPRSSAAGPAAGATPRPC